MLTVVAFTRNCLNSGMNYRCCVFPDTVSVSVSRVEKRGLVKRFPQYLLQRGGEGRLAGSELAVSSELHWQLWQKSFPVTAAASVICHPPTCCQHCYLILRWDIGLYLQTLCLSYIYINVFINRLCLFILVLVCFPAGPQGSKSIECDTWMQKYNSTGFSSCFFFLYIV